MGSNITSYARIKPVDMDAELALLEKEERGTRRQPGGGWVTTPDAAETLFVGVQTLYSLSCEEADSFAFVKRQPRSRNSKLAQGSGWLYWRADLATILKISQGAGISRRSALRVFAAIRRGDIQMPGPGDAA